MGRLLLVASSTNHDALRLLIAMPLLLARVASVWLRVVHLQFQVLFHDDFASQLQAEGATYSQ